MAAVEYDNNGFASGYLVTDITGDLIVDGSDLGKVENNNNLFISKAVPSGVIAKNKLIFHLFK